MYPLVPTPLPGRTVKIPRRNSPVVPGPVQAVLETGATNTSMAWVTERTHTQGNACTHCTVSESMRSFPEINVCACCIKSLLIDMSNGHPFQNASLTAGPTLLDQTRYLSPKDIVYYSFTKCFHSVCDENPMNQ